jgi:hypothetical protein
MAIDLVECPNCETDDHVRRIEMLTGTQRRLRCTNCGEEWLRGEPARQPPPLPTLEEIKKRFPRPEDVEPERLARANELKGEFLRLEPVPVASIAPYWKNTGRCSAPRVCASATRRT